MKRVLLLTVGVVCVFGSAFGQDVGSIDIFSDPGFSDCNITSVAAPFHVYVAHTNAVVGATAVQFLLEVPADLLYVGETSPYTLKIGTSISGVSISYSACKTGTFLLLDVSFLGGSTPACALMSIVPGPGDDQVQVADCNSQSVFLPLAGQARVNDDGSCTCNYLPVAETTWGGIKALYQD